MYKVFVKDIPIYFQKSKSAKSNIFKKHLPSLSLANYNTFTREIEDLDIEDKIFINGPSPDGEIKSFFKHFQWIEAAGGIVRNRKSNKLLFILRNGIWDIPKGGIDEGETPEEAAKREIQEECGINELKIEAKLPPTFHVYFAYGKHWIKKTYWFALKSDQIELYPQKEEGITKAEWFQENQTDHVQENTYRSILDVIEGYLKIYPEL